MLVSIGSGVSIIKVNNFSSFERVSGTMIGGGTLLGLANLLTGVKDFDESKGMALSPNPANDQMVANFTLRSTAQTSYEILDMSGKVVAKSPAGLRIKGAHTLQINTRDLANGNYIFNLVTNGSRLTKTFSVAH
jgi:type II pantothenate kinase